MVRLDPAGQFERVPLVPAADPAAFEGMLFHVEKIADYFVESNGVESPTFKMEVVDLPTVDHLVLEYHFPAYTGLEPRTVDPGGDIAAIKGTEVRLKITPTMATPGGRVLLNENDSAAADEGSRRHAGRQLHRRRAGLLQDRARGTARREGERLAAVHHRRAHRPGPRRSASTSRAATRRPARSRKCSPKCAPTTTSASSSCRCSTR